MNLDGDTPQDLNTVNNEQRNELFNNFIKNYSKSISASLKGGGGGKSNIYNPMMGNNMTQSVSSDSSMPTSAQIEQYLKNPSKYEKQLRNVSNYLNDSVMQYKRTISHFKSILTFRYDLRIQEDYKDEEKDTVINSRSRCNSFLRDFNIPYHAKFIMDRCLVNGGGFYYLQKNEDFITLLEMPIDYCYITGRWDRGITYAIDLNYFNIYTNMQKTMPEMYEYYKIFIEAKKANSPNYRDLQYYPVPIENGFVFTFDSNDTSIIPPFTGVFRDATAIFTYKNLLMQKTALETWKVIAQKIPLDKNNTPILSGEQAQIFIDFAQSVMPSGTAMFATPMEIEEIDLAGSSNQNNIVGRGEELFWRSVGVNGSLMDATDKSSATMKYSLINDEGFSDDIYQQFSDFINLQLRLISRTYRFGVKFYGNKYLDEETLKVYKDTAITTNGLLSKMYAYMGYEPFEVNSNLKLERDLGIKELSIPIISGFQQTGDGKAGAPEKSLEDIGDSGLATRDNDGNEVDG